MNNTYHGIVEIPSIKKFVIGDLLFAELTCAVSEEYTHSWSHYDQIIYILSGKKEVQSPSGKFSIEKGNAIFFKKGAKVWKNQRVHPDYNLSGNKGCEFKNHLDHKMSDDISELLLRFNRKTELKS